MAGSCGSSELPRANVAYISPLSRSAPKSARQRGKPLIAHRHGDLLGGFRPVCEMNSVGLEKQASSDVTHSEWRRQRLASADSSTKKSSGKSKDEVGQSAKMWSDALRHIDATSKQELQFGRNVVKVHDEARSRTINEHMIKSSQLTKVGFMATEENRNAKDKLDSDHCTAHNEVWQRAAKKQDGLQLAKKAALPEILQVRRQHTQGSAHATRACNFRFGASNSRCTVASAWQSVP